MRCIMIEKERVKPLNQQTIKNRPYVVYWMQSSQRVEYNHALEYAISRANDLEKPLIVYFGITDHFPEANLRHYKFMIEGLQEVKERLNKRNIKMIVCHNSPEVGAIELAKKAAYMIVDRGYLRVEREWRTTVANTIDIPLVQVESNVIVPVEEVSGKEEYAAATIRNKLKQWIPYYTKEFKYYELNFPSMDEVLDIPEFDLNQMETLNLDSSVSSVEWIKGGTKEALKWLDEFIEHKLDSYDELRNDPSLDFQSNMSPYLHFGQISPLQIYKKVSGLKSDSFLEELIIRRELSMNFVYYNGNYDDYKCIPAWAKETLEKHRNDKREFIYTKEELEEYKTHDSYWNAAQKELVVRGKMHGYMRMYWGKKIIEWTSSPEVAYQMMVYLNNKYSLDGRDPNGFTGVAWCFGKHDRPWQERPVFGMIRYMNAAGLKRKFDIETYVKKVQSL